MIYVISSGIPLVFIIYAIVKAWRWPRAFLSRWRLGLLPGALSFAWTLLVLRSEDLLVGDYQVVWGILVAASAAPSFLYGLAHEHIHQGLVCYCTAFGFLFGSMPPSPNDIWRFIERIYLVFAIVILYGLQLPLVVIYLKAVL